MTDPKGPITIKKYANRRLYNTGTSTYVTLDDLGDMVRREEDFVVVDAKSGEDITRSVLTQIIFEQENKGQNNLLPVTFLRQLIRFYGDSIQTVVPSYLEMSIAAFAKEQESMRQSMAKAYGQPFEAMEETVRQNTELFNRTLRMFSPFSDPAEPEKKENTAPDASAEELESLRKQLEDMQKKINALKPGG